MIYNTNYLTIELENEHEIEDFYNVIMFALDLQAERDKEKLPCMSADELRLANKLVEITKKRY